MAPLGLRAHAVLMGLRARQERQERREQRGSREPPSFWLVRMERTGRQAHRAHEGLMAPRVQQVRPAHKGHRVR
jgi:hypothetical protein